MTSEISHATNIINPRKTVPFLHGRRPNYFGMLAEAMWPLTRISDLKTITVWNSNLADYSDDGETLYGAYGPRLMPAVASTVETFLRDPGSRQVVLPIFEPRDVGVKSKDVPCNDMVMFKIRDFKLNMTVMNRSNDVHLGLYGVNVPQFSMFMQGMMCSLRNINFGDGERPEFRMGVQTHISDSLHMYLENEQHKPINLRTHSLSGTVKGFNFYNQDPFSKMYAPLRIAAPGDGGWIHIENLMRDISNGFYEGIDHPYVDTSETASMIIIDMLLTMYAKIKNGVLTREDALTNFFNTFIEEYEKRFSANVPAYMTQAEAVEVFPFDWVAGCLATLYWRNKLAVGSAEPAKQFRLFVEHFDLPKLPFVWWENYRRFLEA